MPGGGEKTVLKWIAELQSISQCGLAYSQNAYDIERYQQIQSLAEKMMARYSGLDLEAIQSAFNMQSGYATPKVDVRAFILKANKLLLVKERQDGLWTLPGGWSEVNLSPSENVIKEVKEETGYEAKVIRLIALFDKNKHDHPPQWPHAYKCFFHCEITGGEACPSIETSEVAWFALDALPRLSTPRVTRSQLDKLASLVEAGEAVLFD